ncbi:MAG: acetyl-CoA carboxylase carboxyltransferase subunit beta [Erysipelothrix sp.]|nr:acetyl-CoA carboxylase carboxyltransferase subunit beta [Erysipelothrix sp.]
MKNLFEQRKKQISGFRTIMNVTRHLFAKKEMPDDVIHVCTHCHKPATLTHHYNNLNVCLHCDAHERLSSYERVNQIVDEGTFNPMWDNLSTHTSLNFPDYQKKLSQAKHQSNMNEAVLVGEACVSNHKVALGIMDANFMMGSMGSLVGELITRLIEHAVEQKLPLILFTASGGARMQEGIVSLIQMAKTTQAMAKHHEQGLLSVVVLTHPTTGGVSASFAMLGDLTLAEPNALIGFAGKRVIEKTIQQTLPDHFQSAEFGLDQGFIDMIVHRRQLKETLSYVLSWVKGENHAPTSL